MTDQFLVDRVVGIPKRAEAARELADAAVTLVKGEGKIPERIAYLRVSEEGGGDVFESELRKEATIDEGAEVCVVGLFPAPEAGVEQVRAAAGRYQEVCVVSFGAPRELRSFPEVAGQVCAYGNDEYVQRAAARALTGQLQFQGTLPVRLDV